MNLATQDTQAGETALPAPRQPGYWERVADGLEADRPSRQWRAFCDYLNTMLLREWLPAGEVGWVLKTDSFDEAAGAGVMPVMGELARRVVGIDVAGGMAARASRRHEELSAMAADVRGLPLADASIDAVFSGSTLDHFPTVAGIEAGLGEIHRVLRPGGTLILTLDNRANPQVALRNALPFGLLRAIGLVPYQVGATCGPGQLRELLLAAGFEVEEMRAQMHCPRALAVRLAKLCDRLGRGGSLFMRSMLAFEVLDAWPTRYRTGFFLAVRARRPERAR